MSNPEKRIGPLAGEPTSRTTPESYSNGPDLASTQVAMFENAFGKEPKSVTLGAIIAAIRSDKYAARSRRCRELFAAWKAVCPALDSKKSPEAKAYDDFKKTLPAFCVSGTAASRTEPLVHSGLLQIDCDKLNGRLETLREQLHADPHIAICFGSPSGDGLKLGLRIDGTRHLESFLAAEKYFLETYGVKIDRKVKDPLRLCFVAHDPSAWTREDAEPLPLPDPEPVDPNHNPTERGLESPESADLRIIILPGGSVSISESARVIFQKIAPTHTLFWRGGALAELVQANGVSRLETIKADGFRSRVERHGNLFAWRSDGEGNPVLKRTKMPRDDAAAIMATAEARELLPPIASVLHCPALIETASGDVEILGPGYHPELGGLLIVAGDAPPRVELSEAVASLKRLVEETLFQSGGDQSRALAAYITPALRVGGFLNGNVPMDVAEADDSQAGKGYRQRMVALLYNEVAYPVTQRDGGVGSFDESFGTALVEARPFITLENVRGRLASQHIEGFLTSPEVFNGLFVARVPGVCEQTVNSRRFLIQLSSNGLESTIDLANRASICRIRKRHNFTYRDTREELRRRQPFFLGCVFAVIAEWIAAGKPRTKDTRHDFREWSQTLDWIVQNILDCAPLMDGHQAAQERASNPGLSWVRNSALLVEREGKLCNALIASELAELCHLHGLDIPGVKDSDEERGKMQVGILMSRVFKKGDEISVDGYSVVRGQKEYRKKSGDMDFTPSYTFTNLKSTTQPPHSTQHPYAY